MRQATRAETTSIRGLMDHIGGNDYRGKYYSGSYWRESDGKEAERERVLHFILLHSQKERRVKLLSLPGMSWQFERMLLAERPSGITPNIIGLESSVSIYHRSKLLIPGKRKAHRNSFSGLQEATYRYGNSTCLYARVSAHQRNTRAGKKRAWNRLLLMDASTYTSILVTDYGATKSQKIAFNKTFLQRNAVWLDFTSNLCQSVEESIRNILFCLEPTDSEKPIAITVLNGRDGLRGEEQRLQRVMELQPALTYRDHWTYQGKGGLSMLTMCFTAI